jgi:predicted RNA-binding protein with PUA-like domain
MAKQYWLMKSEPDVFSLDDLKNTKSEPWDGVRNYQARNFMRDGMKVGDLVLFYHSNCKPPGIAGIAEVCKEAYPDHTAFDKKCKYYDAKSDPKKPRWMMVDVKFVKKFKNYISLEELRELPKLKHMKILQKGNRLSITPVEKVEFEFIKKTGQ